MYNLDQDERWTCHECWEKFWPSQADEMAYEDSESDEVVCNACIYFHG